MKQWEIFFEGNKDGFIKTGNMFPDVIIGVTIEMLYQNFKERMLDEMDQERDNKIKRKCKAMAF